MHTNIHAAESNHGCNGEKDFIIALVEIAENYRCRKHIGSMRRNKAVLATFPH